jgi:hypothetical protein
MDGWMDGWMDTYEQTEMLRGFRDPVPGSLSLRRSGIGPLSTNTQTGVLRDAVHAATADAFSLLQLLWEPVTRRGIYSVFLGSKGMHGSGRTHARGISRAQIEERVQRQQARRAVSDDPSSAHLHLSLPVNIP